VETYVDLERDYDVAQAALLAAEAPGTRVRHLIWSRGDTQALELGEGPPLLYVHGGFGCAGEVVPILSQLARNHHVFAVDRPGHGAADPFDYDGVDLLEHARGFLREIADALGLESFDLMGSSIGGLWSAVFSLSAPERVAHLVLLGAPAGIGRPGAPLPLRLLGLPLVGRAALSKPTRASSRRFWGTHLVAHPERVGDTLLDIDIANQRRNRESILSLVRCVVDLGGVRRRWQLGARWRALPAPTLMVWGERDRFGAPELGEAIAASSGHIQVVRIPDAGHLPWIDEPVRVIDEIERFLVPAPEPQVQADRTPRPRGKERRGLTL